MRNHGLAIVLFLGVATASAAQERGRVANMGACSSRAPRFWIAVDGASVSDCSTGNGNTQVVCICHDGVWNALAGVNDYWIDLVVPPTSVKATGAGVPGFSAWKSTLEIYWFDATADESVMVTVQMPHCAVPGSVIAPHVHWVPKTTADGAPANQAVRWCLDYTFAEIGATAPSEATICGNAHVPADANVVADRHYVTALASITPSSLNDGLSAVLVGRLYRDANHGTEDTYEADSGLIGFDAHLRCLKLGSDSEYSY